MDANHGVVHFEIPADDPDKLAEFYTGLFGWQITKMPGEMEYWSVMTVEADENGMPKQPGAINGGMGRRMMPDQKPMNYIAVESVDEYAAKAESLGATVTMAKQPVPGMGWFAMVMDPQGNMFGIWQTDAAAG